MQCASSTTSRPVLASSGSAVSANRGLASRSGETSSTSTSSARSASNTGCQSATLAELTVAARRPARSAAATWSRISASSGEMTSVGPRPASRSAAVAAQ
jgi:hypothetical protein